MFSAMDDIDAPQWADFTAPSPQVPINDYFLRKHEKCEYRNKLDSAEIESPVSTKKAPLSEISYNESIIQKTPIKVVQSKNNRKCSSSKKSNLKETTYENVLMEAMSNLQLSFKKGEKSFNKSCLIDEPTFKTPVKRVTRSMCALANTPKQYQEKSLCASINETVENDVEPLHRCEDEDKENNHLIENNSPATDSSSQLNLEFTSCSENEISYEKSLSKSEPSLVHQSKSDLESKSEQHLDLKSESEADSEPKSETDLESKTELHQEMKINIEFNLEDIEKSNKDIKNQMNNSKHVSKGKVVTSFSSTQSNPGSGKKKLATLTGNAWHRQVKRRMSISNQRRVSIKTSVTSSKYVSMAEAVSKYQNATPQRFRSNSVRTTKTEQLRRSFKLTKAMSPALMCKNRTRPVTALSREEQEKIELEKIRQNQIKANPVRKDILRKPAPLKKVEKKSVTNPEPFHLTEIKKAQPPQKQNPDIKRVHRMFTKTVPSIVSTDDKGVIVKEEEVLHFGIPLEPCKTKKKNTKVMPFSFEARNKVLQMKKQEKLKMMQESEKQKVKAEFHARPVPATVKTPLQPKDNSLRKPKVTLTRSLSFESRVKEVQKKKEEKIKQILEEEKKARTFKAQKVPEFKPVLVRGRSKDNLLKRSHENLSIKPHNVSGNCKKTDNSLKKSHENLTVKQTNVIRKPMIPSSQFPLGTKKINPSTVSSENQENRNLGAVPKILEPKCKLSQKSVAVLTELNTDKRAKQRKEFDEQLKKKEMEEEDMKKKAEEDRIAKEKADKMELRKMTEIKARPMPVYKPLNIAKSNKPLTDAQSPAWAKRKGSSMH